MNTFSLSGVSPDRLALPFRTTSEILIEPVGVVVETLILLGSLNSFHFGSFGLEKYEDIVSQ